MSKQCLSYIEFSAFSNAFISVMILARILVKRRDVQHKEALRDTRNMATGFNDIIMKISSENTNAVCMPLKNF